MSRGRSAPAWRIDGQQRIRIGDGEFEVLRGDAVDQRHRLRRPRRGSARRVPRGAPRDGPRAAARAAALHRGGDRIEERGVRLTRSACSASSCSAWENRSSGDPLRIGAGVGDDEDLRGAGDHVDADGPEHLALRLGDEGAAGTDDLVDARNGLRAVGERRHRLGTADAQHAMHAGEMRGREHERIDPSSGVGAVMTISPTPATDAGIAVISTLDG